MLLLCWWANPLDAPAKKCWFTRVCTCLMYLVDVQQQTPSSEPPFDIAFCWCRLAMKPLQHRFSCSRRCLGSQPWRGNGGRYSQNKKASCWSLSRSDPSLEFPVYRCFFRIQSLEPQKVQTSISLEHLHLLGVSWARAIRCDMFPRNWLHQAIPRCTAISCSMKGMYRFLLGGNGFLQGWFCSQFFHC